MSDGRPKFEIADHPLVTVDPDNRGDCNWKSQGMPSGTVISGNSGEEVLTIIASFGQSGRWALIAIGQTVDDGTFPYEFRESGQGWNNFVEMAQKAIDGYFDAFYAGEIHNQARKTA